MSSVDEAIKASGGLFGLARSCGVSHQAVQKWKKSGKVPPKRVLRVEAVSGVPRERLNPDLYPPESRSQTKRKRG